MQSHCPNVVDVGIDELQQGLSQGSFTCVDLVRTYLTRISTYDNRGPALNSIPILNPDVFEEAEASDERRANGNLLGLLDGIPFTVKDSYKVKGQAVANGSPALQDVIATEDAFVVDKLRAAGAVLIGRTNMCPMAAGGMARGVYGRAESPYNAHYLAAAFASGSSNGSGVSTAASFAAFGLGSETVSSGRSPASNNALVAYTPSKGAISVRGIWPLYPTCDVLVPHARTMDDMLAILDVIAAPDEVARGDFWRDQTFVKLPDTWQHKPVSFRHLPGNASIQGLRIAVPSMYIGAKQLSGSTLVYTSPEVIALYEQAKLDLEHLGATVVEVDTFPVIQNYEYANAGSTELARQYRLPDAWNTTERSAILAYTWEQFLRDNDDMNITSLKQVDWQLLYPAHPADDPQIRYAEPTNRIHYEKLYSFVDSLANGQQEAELDPRSALMAIPNIQSAIQALELMRRDLFEKWLDENKFDAVAFPACGDVGKADADVDYESAEHAWRNGVKYSNGIRALRHLGIPSVTVPMGNMAQKSMPVGLTFLAKAGEDCKLLQWGYAFEQATKRRTIPQSTPEVHFEDANQHTEKIPQSTWRSARPDMKIEKCTATPTSRNGLRINVEGFITGSKMDESMDKPDICLDIIVDAQPVPKEKITIQQCRGTMCGRPVYDFRCSIIVQEPPKQNSRNTVPSRRRIARDSTMVVIVAGEGVSSRKTGYLKLL